MVILEMEGGTAGEVEVERGYDTPPGMWKSRALQRPTGHPILTLELHRRLIHIVAWELVGEALLPPAEGWGQSHY